MSVVTFQCPPPVLTTGCGAASTGSGPPSWGTLLSHQAPLWMYLAGVAVVVLAVWTWGYLSDHYQLAGYRLVRRLDAPCDHCPAHCPDGDTP
jgi:hypothetical protein